MTHARPFFGRVPVAGPVAMRAAPAERAPLGIVVIYRRKFRAAPPAVIVEREREEPTPSRGFSRDQIRLEFSRRWRP